MVEPLKLDMRNAVPASVRKPVERSAFAQGLMSRAQSALGRMDVRSAVAPGSFSRLLNEPEDARLTGVTRSLPRRLLALNLPGSLQGMRGLRSVKVA